MKDQNHDETPEELEEHIVTLQDEDGNDITFDHLMTLEFEGASYILLEAQQDMQGIILILVIVQVVGLVGHGGGRKIQRKGGRGSQPGKKQAQRRKQRKQFFHQVRDSSCRASVSLGRPPKTQRRCT